MSHLPLNPANLFNSVQYGFSQAVIATGVRQIFLSGQVAVDANEALIATGMYAQTQACLRNMRTLLTQAQATMADVVMLRIYIRDDANTPAAQNEIAQALREGFGNTLPASSWVLVSGLTDPSWLLEVEAQAVVADVSREDARGS